MQPIFCRDMEGKRGGRSYPPRDQLLRQAPDADRIRSRRGWPRPMPAGVIMLGLFDFLRRKAGPRTARQETGESGERAAERFLRRHGHRVLERNVRYPRGEVDLVTLERASGAVCFVEVRSRTVGDGEGEIVSPEESVTTAKRRRIIAAARQFLAKRRITDRVVRFDVVTVRFDGRDRRRPDVRYYPGAFDAAGRLR